MEKKVFSVKDGNIIIDEENNYIGLYNEQMRCIASNLPKEENYAFGKKLYDLPFTLIRKQKSDEELAEVYYKSFEDIKELRYSSFLAGRKSFGDKVYSKDDMISFAKWLQKEDVEDNAEIWFHYADSDMLEYWLKEVYSKAIYPHTIEVDFDGNNYLWKTLNAIYE